MPRAWPAVLGGLAGTALDAVLLGLALGGARALLAHPRAVALLLVWTVGAVVLALLRPVRSNDPKEVHRERGWTLPALLLLPLLTPPLSAWGERHGFWRLPGGEALGWCGVALAAAGFALRIAAMAQLGSRFSPLVAVQKEHALETRGLYARIRHPGYLGAWTAALGGALAFRSALAFPVLALMLIVLETRMRGEEETLERHFGDEWRRYRERSGRFWPRLG